MQASILSSIRSDGDESYNPWENPISRSMANVLLLAEKTGHLQRSNTDAEDLLVQTKEKLPSLKLISLLREITEKRKEYNEVYLEVQQRMDEKETRDITHLDVLELKVKEINELNSYLQSIINGKDFLLTKLQQPFVGEFLKLEAAYHKFASELFPQISCALADLSAHMDTADWAVRADLSNNKFDSVFSDLNTCLAKMQTHFQALCRFRSSMGKLVKQRETSLN